MPVPLIDVSAEYAKDKNLKKDDVQSVMTWANKQHHLPPINELQAILFLQSCYYSNEAAKTALDTYFTVKTLCPEIFASRTILKSTMKETADATVMVPLPKETPEGYTIFFIENRDGNSNNFVLTDQCRLFDMITMLHLYEKGTSNGHLIVYDVKALTFGHLTKMGPLTIKKFLFYLQDAMPVRLKGLHFFNIVPIMDKMLALIKPFMKKELLSVLYLHNTVDDLAKFVPKECLPQEYGGSVDAIPILHEKIRNDLRKNVELFEWEEKQTVDESKRLGKAKNAGDYFGVEGTFKKLELD